MKMSAKGILGAAALCGLLLAIGCGGSSTSPGGDGGTGGGGGGSANGCSSVQGSCKQAGGLACSDYAGEQAVALTAFQSACSQGGGTWSTSACNTSGAVGGCKNTAAGQCTVIWDFVSGTASQAQTDCTNGGSSNTWVTP